MHLTFLGTGPAWGLPELNCDCLICRRMRRQAEQRRRTALLLEGEDPLLIDCGPDIAAQLLHHQTGRPAAVLITHEHGDHFLGLDELFSYKRSAVPGQFTPIPVYLSSQSRQMIEPRFGYLEELGVIQMHEVLPQNPFQIQAYEIIPFKTFHGPFAAGSIGYLIKTKNAAGQDRRLVYTSDFMDIPEPFDGLERPDYLIIQTYYFNEPQDNHPHHMSLQRALDFIGLWQPVRETFLVHLGDADQVPGDPANNLLKKKTAKQPMISPEDGKPYPIPLDQADWQARVDQIREDYQLPCKITVPHDGLVVSLD